MSQVWLDEGWKPSKVGGWSQLGQGDCWVKLGKVKLGEEINSSLSQVTNLG